MADVEMIARALKLHIESRSKNSTDLEIQRRIWWHLIYLDVEASVMSGLPVLIHEDDYNTKMPAIVDDVIIEALQDDLEGEQKSPRMIAMKSRLLWALQVKVWRKRPPIDKEFQDFKQKIMSLMNDISDFKQHKGTRIYIHMQLDRAVTSAAQSFLNGKAIRSIPCDHQVLK